MTIRLSLVLAIVSLMTATSVSEAQCAGRAKGLQGAPNAKVVFSLSISAPQMQVKVGDALNIVTSYTNITDRVIGISVAALDDSRSVECFEIVDGDGKQVASRMLRDLRELRPEEGDEGSQRIRFIDPGESHTSPVDLSMYYDLERPGTYTAQFFRWSREGSLWVKSNKIAISIVP